METTPNPDKAKVLEIVNDLVTVKEACSMLQISRTRLNDLAKIGKINFLRFDFSGRKIFLRHSQILALFPKNIQQNA